MTELTTSEPSAPRAPLRLVLVTAGATIPSWLVRCLSELEQCGAARVVAVCPVTPPAHRHDGNAMRRWNRALFRLHGQLDRSLFRRRPDALAPVDLRIALPGRSVLAAASGAPALAGPVDLVLDPFSLLPDASLADGAAYGLWSIAFGKHGDPRTQAHPSFWEVIEGAPATEARLCVQRRGLGGTRPVYVLRAPTDRRSVWRSRNHVCWKLSAALATRLRRLWEDPEKFLERLTAATPFDIAPRRAPDPGSAAMLRAGAALARRYVADKWQHTRYHEQWALACQRGPNPQLRIGSPQGWIPPPDREWADPFPVRVGSEYYVFHEELRAEHGKGTIVVTVLGDDGRATAWGVPVLETDYHLSYPCVFEWDGDFFMIPETASDHRVQLFRCVQFPTQWKLERVLLDGVRGFDPTPAHLFGRWWLFVNVAGYGAETGAGSMDELHLFHADTPLGPWTAHRGNPVKSDVRSTRPAGRVFEHAGAFYRPAQDCSAHYGHAVSINRILQLDTETFVEREVEKITPQWGPQVTGVHTFNVAGDLTVIDCVVRRRKALPGWRARRDTGNGMPEIRPLR